MKLRSRRAAAGKRNGNMAEFEGSAALPGTALRVLNG